MAACAGEAGLEEEGDIDSAVSTMSASPHREAFDEQDRAVAGFFSTCGGCEAPTAPLPEVLLLFDNARFFLTFVTSGQRTLIEFMGTRWFSSIFRATSMTYMMPAYVVFAGYSASTEPGRRDFHTVIKIGVVYSTAQILNLLMLRLGEPILSATKFGLLWLEVGTKYVEETGNCESCWKVEDWLAPAWALWYLPFVIVASTVLPLWWRLRYPLASAWALAAAVPCLKLSRDMGQGSLGQQWSLPLELLFAWFPLFVLGAVARERRWRPWEHRWGGLAGVAVLAALVWLPAAQTAIARGEFSPRGLCPQEVAGAQQQMWEYLSDMDAVNGLVGDDFFGRVAKTLLRMFASLVQACCVWGLLQATPRRRLRIVTGCGRRSLANYLFHPLSGVLISFLGAYGPPRADGTAPWWGELVAVLMTVVTSLLWMTPWAWKAVSLVVDPPLGWLLRPASPKGAEGALGAEAGTPLDACGSTERRDVESGGDDAGGRGAANAECAVWADAATGPPAVRCGCACACAHLPAAPTSRVLEAAPGIPASAAAAFVGGA